MRKITPSKRSFRMKASLALAAATMVTMLAVGAGQDDRKPQSKERTIERMLEIGDQYGELRSVHQSAEVRRAIERLLAEYEALSASLGGDDPARLGVGRSRNATGISNDGALATAPVAPPGCNASTASFSNPTASVIPVVPVGSPVTSVITVAGADPFLWDVNVITFIEHLNCPDLDMTITSPAGTVVTLTTDNGLGANNFNGTTWDDSANPAGQVPYASNNGLATDHAYTNGSVAANLVPEEALGAFFGEDPNGNWILSISDDTSGNGGTLTSWSLEITTAAVAPTLTASAPFDNATAVAISSSGTPTITSTIDVSGLDPVLADVNLITFITHTSNADLDITLTSPAGTVVTITTDNGLNLDNVFNGTFWDDSANPGGTVPYVSNNGLVTDHVYVNNTLGSPLVPEEALAAFIGEDPNGTWTLTISDDATGDGGALNAWSLVFETTDAVPSLTTTPYTNNTPAQIDGPVLVTSTIVVSGMGDHLWDIDVLTTILHTANNDLDITVMSPAGTVVTLTTDNGATLDNAFNGTTWDDSANPGGQVPYTSNNGLVTDHAYSNLVTATPLVSEEPLGAFIGENPNGVWTLTINDDTPASNGGSFNGWSLNVTTLDAPPTMDSSLNFENTTQQIITTGAPPQVLTSTVQVSGAASFLCDVNLNLNITHTFNGDLDITLMSPAGTVVTITTDNGASNDNVFAGTTFDDSANPGGQVPFVFNNGSVTDHQYQNLVVVPLLTPEEALAAFIGENPNGDWTLTVSDDSNGDGGAINSWSIDIVTCACSVAPPCPADISPPGGDGQVNVSDLLLVIGSWGACANCPPDSCDADINNDCQINVTDLLAVIGAWGACP